jgi:prepilin-type N-terminal cleavage/methylation domain-containing protein
MKPISKTKRAFTLVEILLVISIIAVLAALTVGLYSVVRDKTVESTILAEMEQVKLALQSYKEKHGNFPPSYPPPPPYPLSGPTDNKLYYYLSGEAELMRSPDLTDLTELHDMNPGEIKERRMDGGIKNLLPNLKKEQFHTIVNGKLTNLGILYSPLPDKDDTTKRAPWIYNSRTPTHNRETYDLSVKIWDKKMVNKVDVFKMLDANGDGELSNPEISNAPEMLKPLDRNNDEKLDFDELKTLDRNNDGQLTFEEDMTGNVEQVEVLDLVKEIGNW